MGFRVSSEAPVTTAERSQTGSIIAVAAVFVLTFAVRWAILPNSLEGDEHWSLWTAATFLKGDRPFRDFADVGDPLYWGMSAFAQVVAGYRLIGEVVLGITLVAFACAVSFHLAWHATRSLPLAAGLTALAFVAVTQRTLYSYPKIFLYPLGLWLCWRYIDRPTLLRTVALAMGVAVAFGYRHDHGAYVGVGAAAAVLAAHWTEGTPRIMRAWMRFGVVLILVLSPYLALIQAHEGIVQYFEERIRVGRRLDASSRRLVSFSVDAAAPRDWFGIEPPRPGRVIVEWTPDVNAETKGALERRYSLTNRQEYSRADNREKWEYTLTDVSADNIRAIVDDPRVYDTGLIDRNTYRPLEESWLVRVQRSLPLFRISVAPRYWHAGNAGIVLHYVSFALPYVMFILLVSDAIRGRRCGRMVNAPEKMFAAAVLMAVAHYALLRREGYFADHAAAAAVLGACVLGHTFSAARDGRRAPARTFSRAIAVAVLIVSIFAVNTYARPLGSLAELDDGLRGVWRRSVDAFRSYSTSPPIDAYAPRGTTGDRGLVRYIYECTRPDDRVWLLTDLFTFPYYTERRVVGHIYWVSGFLADAEYQRRTIARVDKEEVPIILAVGGREPLQYLESYPLVREYVAQRYREHYTVPQEGKPRDQVFWLLTDSRRKPTGTYELFGLPCFK